MYKQIYWVNMLLIATIAFGVGSTSAQAQDKETSAQGTQKLDLGNLSQGLYQVVIRQHGMVIKSQKQVIRK